MTALELAREDLAEINDGRPDAEQTSPLAAGLAKATAIAGKKLERIVDAYRAGGESPA